MVVQKFQEHHPCEHGQTVAISIQSLVLAHDVACGLDDRAELLGSGLRLGCFLRSHRFDIFPDYLSLHADVAQLGSCEIQSFTRGGFASSPKTCTVLLLENAEPAPPSYTIPSNPYDLSVLQKIGPPLIPL